MLASRSSVLARSALVAAALLVLPRFARADDLQPLKLVIVISDDVTPVLYAAQSGIFKRLGLAVDLVVVNSGAAAAAAVAGGAAQIGISSLMNLLEAHERGVPFVLVAPGSVITTDDGYSQFIVLKDAPIRTARDLNGKTIAVPALKDLQSAAIMNWMDKNGGDPSSLRFVELPVSAAAVAVEEGRVDGANVNTPTLTRALDRGKVRVLAQVFNAIGPRFTNTVWFATTDYVNGNRGAIEHFARAIHEASLYFNAHRADTAPMVASYMKLEPGLVARMARCTFGEDLNAKDIQPLIDLSLKYKLIAKALEPRDLISAVAARAGR
jgi:ABC-type nitrate/sulfonate/bicarbonate transport system substrate-binding protein